MIAPEGGLSLRKGNILTPMHFVFHIGMHCTDEDTALRCLLRNAAALAQTGSVVSLPARFKPVLREAMIELRGARADAALQDKMKTALFDAPNPHRVLFSNDNFVCPPARALIGPKLYPLAAERLPWIRNLFPADTVEFAFGIRNPVTLMPALHARFAKGEPFVDYLDRLEPDKMSWAEAVKSMRAAVPDARFTLWCNEDTPLIWPEILHHLSGTDAPLKLKGVHDLLGKIMTPAGLSRYTAYLETNPPKSVQHRHRITAAFLDKFARPDAIEMEFDAPELTEARVTAITARYEADIAILREMEGVHLIAA